jgi:hypothetical protein
MGVARRASRPCSAEQAGRLASGCHQLLDSLWRCFLCRIYRTESLKPPEKSYSISFSGVLENSHTGIMFL